MMRLDMTMLINSSLISWTAVARSSKETRREPEGLVAREDEGELVVEVFLLVYCMVVELLLICG